MAYILYRSLVYSAKFIKQQSFMLHIEPNSQNQIKTWKLCLIENTHSHASGTETRPRY